MKSVLISIKPRWCELIASGKKTVEVRKTAPKLEAPFKCYIYQTRLKWAYSLLQRLGFDRTAERLASGLGMVIGEFICDFVVDGRASAQHWVYICENSYVPGPEIYSYCGEDENGDTKYCYGWHIKDPVIYDEPKPLWKFMKCGAPSEKELDEELCSYCEQTEWGERSCYGTPTGPVMCEGAFCGEAYDLYLDEHFTLKRPPQSWCYVEEVKW